jgi:nitrogen fixation protein NifU and related proteins
MNAGNDLYQELILDHGRKPRNFHALEAKEGSDVHRADGHNPLCGDRVTVWVETKGDVMKDASFQGSGCAISTASASLMTGAVKGRTVDEVRALFDKFHDLVTGKGAEEDLGKLAAFSGVSEFPMRVKCATLAWHTLLAALEDRAVAVSTE